MDSQEDGKEEQMNKWKIDIWHGHTIVDTYENKKLEKVMEWYEKSWKSVFNNEGFSFHVYNTDYRKNKEIENESND